MNDTHRLESRQIRNVVAGLRGFLRERDDAVESMQMAHGLWLRMFFDRSCCI